MILTELYDRIAQILLEKKKKGRCWKGYKPTPGVKPYAKGSCQPVSEAKSPAWQRKEGKNPEGGLNAKGRASARAQGHNLKPPVSAKQAKKSPAAAARRSSFCARMGEVDGPMEDSKGRPTRKALALRKWDC
jgi:Domain of unknown function (DUF6321)